MGWTSKVKDTFNNMDRSVLLGAGLVVIAALVVVTFVLGDTEQVAEENANTESSQQEQNQTANGDNGGNGETASNTDDAESSEEMSEQSDENTDASDEEMADTSEQAPSQLADTGPVSAAAALALGAGGYVYYRSRNNLRDHRKE